MVLLVSVVGLYPRYSPPPNWAVLSAMVLWARGRDPIFILCQVEEGYAREQGWIDDIRTYKEFVTRPTDLLADTLAELGLEQGHVAMELDYFAAEYFTHLRERLPRLQISSCAGMLERTRMIKSRRENTCATPFAAPRRR